MFLLRGGELTRHSIPHPEQWDRRQSVLVGHQVAGTERDLTYRVKVQMIRSAFVFF
jgi:hypothetical protein